MTRPIGKIKVSGTLLRDHWQESQFVFARIVPLSMEWQWYDHCVITAQCDEFEQVDEACAVPFYEAVFTKDGDNPPRVEFRKVAE